MTTIPLFRDTNMTSVTSCENTLYKSMTLYPRPATLHPHPVTITHSPLICCRWSLVRMKFRVLKGHCHHYSFFSETKFRSSLGRNSFDQNFILTRDIVVNPVLNSVIPLTIIIFLLAGLIGLV